jgi:hypothetical protein
MFPEIVATAGSLLLKVKAAGLAEVGATSANGWSPSVFEMGGNAPSVTPLPPQLASTNTMTAVAAR